MAKSVTPSSTRKNAVADALRARILDGEIGPGVPLRQVPLSQEFGVAQSVIRESLQVLERQGLVFSKQNLGVFVREMGLEEILGAWQVREVLEGLAARLCCRTVSRADVEWLEEAARRIHAAGGASKRRERSELEFAFHHRFVELSRNETLRRQSEGYRFVGDLVVTDRDAEVLLEEHLAMVEAVANDRPEEAERVARAHVAASAASIRDQWAE